MSQYSKDIRSFASRAVLTAFVVMAVLTAAIWVIASARTQTGTPKMVGVGKPSLDPKFPTVGPVSGTPGDWVPAVCQERVYQSRVGPDQLLLNGIGFLSPNTTFNLPGASYSAVCRARATSASDPVLLLAEYPAEDPMQVDFANNDVKWYCFAGHHGRLLAIATRAGEEQTGSSGLAVSPVLQPLTAYGFVVYGDPGL